MSTTERAQLQQQIHQLQQRLATLDQPPTTPPPPAPNPPGTGKRSRKNVQVTGPLPPALAAAPKRHIALLFSYEGWAHSGLAYQPKSTPTPLPTVEACLLEALEKARLVEPIVETDGFGCGFERCGRTDAGVSSSAQVINLWVRSDLEDPMNMKGREVDPLSDEGRRHARSRSPALSSQSSDADPTSPTATPDAANVKRKPPSDVELPYIVLLNRHLPPSIRIHAWSPVSAKFSSRFSCIWRHYKYFFSSSPVKPFLLSQFDFGAAYAAAGLPHHATNWHERLEAVDWNGLRLDVELMRDAVSRVVGEHDFVNFCKVDPPKQLQTHVRTVNTATIDPVEGEGDDMWVLNLRGGAFLYNQVRHIVAILFLVGARLEPPSIVDSLLWTPQRTPHTIASFPSTPSSPIETREVMDRKPGYQMAEDLPLILWQCGFNNSELDWRTDNAPRAGDVKDEVRLLLDHDGRQKESLDPHESFRRLFLEMNETYTQHRLKGIVLKHHLASFAFHAPPVPSTLPPPPSPSLGSPSSPPKARTARPLPGSRTVFTPIGAGSSARTTSFIPLLRRKRGELFTALNERWAAGRGSKKMLKREEGREESDERRAVNLRIKEEAYEEARRVREGEEMAWAAKKGKAKGDAGEPDAVDKLVREVEEKLSAAEQVEVEEKKVESS